MFGKSLSGHKNGTRSLYSVNYFNYMHAETHNGK